MNSIIYRLKTFIDHDLKSDIPITSFIMVGFFYNFRSFSKLGDN